MDNLVAPKNLSANEIIETNHTELAALEQVKSLITDCETCLRPKTERRPQSPTRTGYSILDSYIGGLHPNELIVLASRPGVGKTQLALQIAQNAARLGASVMYFSLEMSAGQLATRLLSQASHVPLEKLRQENAALSEAEMIALKAASKEFESLGLRVDDSRAVSLAEIAATMKAYAGLSENVLCIIDYLQLITPPIERLSDTPSDFKGFMSNSRAHEIEHIVYGLKTIAESLHIPVLALSSLPRVVGPLSQKDRRPLLRDFRNPSIILGADTILLLDRSLSPEEAAIDHRPDEHEADIIIAKNAHGICRDHTVCFNSKCMLFSEQDKS